MRCDFEGTSQDRTNMQVAAKLGPVHVWISNLIRAQIDHLCSCNQRHFEKWSLRTFEMYLWCAQTQPYMKAILNTGGNRSTSTKGASEIALRTRPITSTTSALVPLPSGERLQTVCYKNCNKAKRRACFWLCLGLDQAFSYRGLYSYCGND